MKKNKHKGFTIVETLIAVAVVALALIGPLGIASNGLRNTYLAKDQLAAISLAQDALEYMHNVKDQNRVVNFSLPTPVLPDPNWLSGLSNCVPNINTGHLGCIIDSANNTIDFVTPGHANGPILYDSATGLYGYKNGWATTKFTRLAVLNEFAPTAGCTPAPGVVCGEATLTSTVTWNDPYFGAQSVSLSENVLGW